MLQACDKKQDGSFGSPGWDVITETNLDIDILLKKQIYRRLKYITYFDNFVDLFTNWRAFCITGDNKQSAR